MSNFPASIISFTNPTSSNTLNNPSHAQQHIDENTEIMAIETKVGVDGSAVVTSFDYKLATGWQAISATLTYSSADAPTYIVGTSVDLRGTIGVGMRMKFTNNSTTFYGIVTAITASLITLYGGTDYAVANSAITLPFYSRDKAPLGFPTSPDKWSQSVSDSSDRTQSSPVNTTWYNPGGVAISIPIGCWNVRYTVQANYIRAAATCDQEVSLSNANNSESDTEFSVNSRMSITSATALDIQFEAIAMKVVTVASKTSYYLITKSSNSASSIAYLGSTIRPTLIKAVCAYL